MEKIHRRIGDALISVGALGALLALLAAFDPRVREQITLRIGTGRASADAAEAGATLQNLALLAFSALRDQSIEQAPLVIFVLAAFVQELFMLRT
jgi:hypothetical protein